MGDPELKAWGKTLACPGRFPSGCSAVGFSRTRGFWAVAQEDNSPPLVHWRRFCQGESRRAGLLGVPEKTEVHVHRGPEAGPAQSRGDPSLVHRGVVFPGV